MKETMYILVMPNGNLQTCMISGWRKGVEIKWLSVWDDITWKQFYRQGYRIKKCIVTTELI